jgi:undecaprenyl-diphosphatase
VTQDARLPRRVLLVAGAAFALLALGALGLGVLPADATVRETLLAAASPDLVALMRVVNRLGDWRLLLPATLVLLAVSRRARARWWVWVGLMVVAPLTEGALKWLVARPRPEGLAAGFPSGHATAAAAFFGAVIYLSAPLAPGPRAAVRALAVAAIVLVALARVLLRAHWPSDAVAGIALGLALASAAAVVAAASAPAPTPR